MRIALAVADDEAHVDRLAVGVDRVDVTTGPQRGLEHRHVDAAGQRVRGREAGDAGADDRDGHEQTLLHSHGVK